MNLHALLKRLNRICRSRSGSTRQSAEVVLGLEYQAVLVLLGKLARSTDHLFDQRRELHGLRIELKFPGFDLRQVEHLVDEAKQVSSGGFTRCSGSCAFSVPKRAALVTIISVSPMMALSGVRSSWLMLETNCDLFSLAIRSCRFLSWISSNSRTFSIAITAWSAKVVTSSICLLGKWPHLVARQR